MRSILRNTTILSSSSLASIVVGLLAAKGWAVMLGPLGMGNMALLQSLFGLAGLIAGLGIGTGLVRAGANALAQHDQLYFAALRRAAWLIILTFGTIALLLLILMR